MNLWSSCGSHKLHPVEHAKSEGTYPYCSRMCKEAGTRSKKE